MNSSSLICDSSRFSASNAKMENVEAAIRSRDPAFTSAFRSSPSSSLTLSMMRTVKHRTRRRRSHPFKRFEKLRTSPTLSGGVH